MLRRSLILVLLLWFASLTHAEDIRLGIIDFYGLGDLPVADVRAQLQMKEGDKIPQAELRTRVTEVRAHIGRLAGVADSDIAFICCNQEQAIVYVGIRRTNVPATVFRDPPRGDARLPPEVVAAGQALGEALMVAVREGRGKEDFSQGHSLATDVPAARAAQERFIGFARDSAQLRSVLRNAADPQQRALAAQVIAYAPDKTAVVDDLVYALSDPDPGVRNNAVRALGIMALAAVDSPRPMPAIPVEPFIGLMHSVIWSDRNKAALVLLSLTVGRDPAILAKLQRQALTPLVEMARWKSDGHATAALHILGRIADMPASEMDLNNREAIIEKVSTRQLP